MKKAILIVILLCFIPALMFAAVIDEGFFLEKPKNKWITTHLGSKNILAAFNITSGLDCCIIMKVKNGQYAINVMQFEYTDSFIDAKQISVIVDGTSYICDVVQNNPEGCLALFDSKVMQALVHGYKLKVKVGSDVVLDFSLKGSAGPLREVMADPM
ncbi:MAG: hypothetical protein K9K64_09085 [Desulfohalobiaceae bacterium]|nr:hypothetical protein [Desulfohalobiaceae bacterium]